MAPPIESLDELLAKQSNDIIEISPNAVISIREISAGTSRRACVRRAEIPNYPALELTGFVEFPKSIFFVVLFTTPVVERRNVRKLEYLLRKGLPISVRHAD
jgi:hypothetical protein